MTKTQHGIFARTSAPFRVCIRIRSSTMLQNNFLSLAVSANDFAIIFGVFGKFVPFLEIGIKFGWIFAGIESKSKAKNEMSNLT